MVSLVGRVDLFALVEVSGVDVYWSFWLYYDYGAFGGY